MLFQIDLKKVKTTFQEVFRAVYELVTARNSLLIYTRLWTDYYQTTSRYFFWYQASICESLTTMSLAQAKRFELRLGLVELEGNPLYTVIYMRPGYRD